MQADAVETALDNLRPALTVDGYDLRLGSIRPDGAVEVVLEAMPGACLECLVPDAMMVQLLETAIRAEDGSLDHVVLTKQGFEKLSEH